MAESKYSSLIDYKIIFERTNAVLTDTKESAKTISKRTRLHPSTVYNITYEKSLGLEAIVKICEAYHVSSDFLLGLSDDVGNYHINDIKTFSKSIGKNSLKNPETITIEIHPGEIAGDRILELICNIEDCDNYDTRIFKMQNRMGKYFSNLFYMFKHVK